jgi:hypothetical protein
MELDTVCCWAKVPIEKKNKIKSIVFHIFEFIKRLSDQIASSICLIHYGWVSLNNYHLSH